MSSQSVDIRPVHPPVIPNVNFFEEINGNLSIFPANFRLVRNEFYFFGVLINGLVHPICDSEGRRVIVRTINMETLPMTQEIAQIHGFNRPPWNHH